MFDPLGEDDAGITCTPCGLRIGAKAMPNIKYLGVTTLGIHRVQVSHDDGFVSDYYFADEVQDELFITEIAEKRKALMQGAFSLEELIKRGHTQNGSTKD